MKIKSKLLSIKIKKFQLKTYHTGTSGRKLQSSTRTARVGLNRDWDEMNLPLFCASVPKTLQN